MSHKNISISPRQPINSESQHELFESIQKPHSQLDLQIEDQNGIDKLNLKNESPTRTTTPNNNLSTKNIMNEQSDDAKSESENKQYQEINEKEKQCINENIIRERDPFFMNLFLKIENGRELLAEYHYYLYKEGKENQILELQIVIQITDDWYEFIIKAQNLKEIQQDFYGFDCFDIYSQSCNYINAFWKVAKRILNFDEYFIKHLIINHFVVENSERKRYISVERILEISDIEKEEIKIQEYKSKANEILQINYY